MAAPPPIQSRAPHGATASRGRGCQLGAEARRQAPTAYRRPWLVGFSAWASPTFVSRPQPQVHRPEPQPARPRRPPDRSRVARAAPKSHRQVGAEDLAPANRVGVHPPQRLASAPPSFLRCFRGPIAHRATRPKPAHRVWSRLPPPHDAPRHMAYACRLPFRFRHTPLSKGCDG